MGMRAAAAGALCKSRSARRSRRAAGCRTRSFCARLGRPADSAHARAVYGSAGAARFLLCPGRVLALVQRVDTQSPGRRIVRVMANHPVKTAWILVAHRAGAAIYESHGAGLPLARVADIDNPAGRLKAIEVDSDRPGRAFDRVGGGRHSMSVEDGVPEHLARAFVNQLAVRLERGRLDHAFERLVLVAPPKLLGSLRAALPEALRALLVAELPKDLARSDGDQVREALSDRVLV